MSTASIRHGGVVDASPERALEESAALLPPQIRSWLAAQFADQHIPPFEDDAVAIDTLTELYSIVQQQEQLSELLDTDVQSKLAEYQQDNQYQAAMLAALSMLPSDLAATLPTALTSPRSQLPATFTPSASLSTSLSALTSLCLHLSPHSVDEAALTAALIAHKTAEQDQQHEHHQLAHDVQQLQRNIHATQHAIIAHQHLLAQLDQAAPATQAATAHYNDQQRTYAQKHKEYSQRLHAAQQKLERHPPGLSALLAEHEEAEVLEARLQRLRAEVAVWDGLSSDVRVARRQVAEAETDVVRLEDEIERRLCAMSAYD